LKDSGLRTQASTAALPHLVIAPSTLGDGIRSRGGSLPRPYLGFHVSFSFARYGCFCRAVRAVASDHAGRRRTSTRVGRRRVPVRCPRWEAVFQPREVDYPPPTLSFLFSSYVGLAAPPSLSQAVSPSSHSRGGRLLGRLPPPCTGVGQARKTGPPAGGRPHPPHPRAGCMWELAGEH